ncbi:hypothetical protein BURC_03807 [Burkholderiaceae bacterium]|nr:hypothetical protein BURC_03807 [Burkholderiaceae bacterium]
MTLLQRFLPEFQFSESHHLTIHAPPAQVLDAAARIDLADDPIVAALLRMRSWPARLARTFGARESVDNWRRFGLANFVPLGRDADREVAYGLVGRFWQSSGGLVPMHSPEAFARFGEPGVAKLVMSFSVQPAGDATRLSTSTRVHCPDAESRRRFTPYWLLIRPASGFIRMRGLRRVKTLVEQAPVGSGTGPAR